METVAATEETKTALENTVSNLLAEKLAASTTSIASGKYLTADNELVYVTSCFIPGISTPRIRVQLFARVKDGVHEDSYALYADHRLERTSNDMIFGRRQEAPSPETPQPVSEEELTTLLSLLATLGPENQTL